MGPKPSNCSGKFLWSKRSDDRLLLYGNEPEHAKGEYWQTLRQRLSLCESWKKYCIPHVFNLPVCRQVVDAEMNILLRGGVGELVVEGPLVGRGYHGRPDLTQKVFKAWPTADSWAYRTGDLVRKSLLPSCKSLPHCQYLGMMPDSTIEILGRIDTQIKLRGVRIESEGISAVVRKACPPGSNFALDAVTVLAKHPSIGIQQLVSFISWDPSISVLIRKSKKPRPVSPPPECLKKIREVCEAELASYMRPSHIVPLNWLPLSSNGKADEKMLINLFTGLDIKYLTSLMDCEGVQGRPLTDVERTVYDILRQHVPFDIGAAHPGINLFECGLDSMGIVRFTTAMKERSGQRLHVSDIMRSPTLEEIASLLETGSARVAPNPNDIDDFVRRPSPQVYEAYPKNSVEAIYPPFTIQEGVLSRSAVNDTLYVQHVLLHCISDVSISNLKEAWTSVMSDQPILRYVPPHLYAAFTPDPLFKDCVPFWQSPFSSRPQSRNLLLAVD